MEYLKYFESVRFYEELKHIDFMKVAFNNELARGGRDLDEYSGKNWVPFTPGEVRELNKISNYKLGKDTNTYISWRCSDSVVISRNISTIIKFDDGWFYASIFSRDVKIWKYFKCDQWDGLINCLKDNI